MIQTIYIPWVNILNSMYGKNYSLGALNTLLNVLNDTDNHKYVNLVLIRLSF